jgi:hypothetical protein
VIGFVSAISAALAIIILVVISSLVGYVQSIMPAKGLIQLTDTKYRYVMEGKYVDNRLIEEVILQFDNVGISNRILSYQTGCNYGFNTQEREMLEVATYNYLTLGQYFDTSVPVDKVNNYSEPESLNVCFIDVNLRPAVD